MEDDYRRTSRHGHGSKKHKKKHKKKSRYSGSDSDYAPRRSTRTRKVLYDDDFVIDGSGSEVEKEPTYEESWGSETESDEDYGKRKKKSGGGGGSSKKRSSAPKKKSAGKKKSRRYSDDEDEIWEASEDSDFETKSRKKRHTAKVGDGSSRSMRGVKNVVYDDDEEESQEAKPLAKSNRPRIESDDESEPDPDPGPGSAPELGQERPSDTIDD